MAKLQCNFISYTLRRAIDISIVLPTPVFGECLGENPRHTPKSPYPLLYLLHGMGNNHATWTSYTNVEMYAEERQIAVVMLSAENKRYIKVGDDDFFTFLSSELPDFVGGLFPVSKRPEDTYIAGLSMGGYGAFVHALNFPERFAAVGAFSAAVRLNPVNMEIGVGADIPIAYQPFALADNLVAQNRTFPGIYIACGQKDFLYKDNVAFKDHLLKLGAALTWVNPEQYGHEWRFWDQQIEAFLDWIPRTDAYKDSKRGV